MCFIKDDLLDEAIARSVSNHVKEWQVDQVIKNLLYARYNFPVCLYLPFNKTDDFEKVVNLFG